MRFYEFEAALTPSPSPTPWARGDGPSPSPVKRERDRLARASQGEGKVPRPSAAVRQAARDNRKAPTSSERILWNALRHRQFANHKFRRQHPVGPFILDFYCPTARLAIEIDGQIHARQSSADRDRQRALESFGIRFLRLPSQLVEQDLDQALLLIVAALTDCPSPAAAGEGSGVRA